jgi:hypothetical protein
MIMRIKILTVLATVSIIVGFTAMNASAWGWGQMPMMGGMFNNTGNQQYSEDMRAIQMKLTADQTELNALIASGNADPKRIRALSEEIAAGQLALESQYAAGANGYGSNMMGSGMMNGGMMNGGMMGPGMMNGGMMGCW